jgi:YD repeat-containing protein
MMIAFSEQYNQSWTLDGLGNWSEFDDDGVSQSRTVNEANEIIDTDGIATPQYDLAGNMISDGTKDYVFDAWNRLVEVDEGVNVIAQYQYDGQNRRVEKITSAQTRHYYLSDQNQVLEERVDASTIAERQNVWGVRYVDDLVCRFRGHNT